MLLLNSFKYNSPILIFWRGEAISKKYSYKYFDSKWHWTDYSNLAAEAGWTGELQELF